MQTDVIGRIDDAVGALALAQVGAVDARDSLRLGGGRKAVEDRARDGIREARRAARLLERALAELYETEVGE